MLASRKYFMSHQWAYTHAALDMDSTSLVWKNITAPERDLVPFMQRDDFYDAKESWGEDAEVLGELLKGVRRRMRRFLPHHRRTDFSPTPHDDDALPTAAGDALPIFFLSSEF